MEFFLNVTLAQFLETQHTCPEISWCLCSILSSQIRGTEPTFSDHHGRNEPRFMALLHAQKELGWEQIVQGRLAKQWSRIQDDYLDQHNHRLKLDRKFHSGEIWTRKLITLLWSTVRACWDHRNSSRHGNTKEENHHAIWRSRLLVSIRALYNEAPHMLAADRDTLALPLENCTKKSPAGLELWLRRTCTIAKLSKQDALAALKRTYKNITEYFKPRKKNPKENADGSTPT
jgi:hypothetical protein